MMWLRSLIWLAAALVMLGALGVSVVYLVIEVVRRKQRKEVVGFFHPFTNDGGGGERVLWCAVKAIQEQFPRFQTVIYTGDPATPQFLADRACRLFGVQLPSPPEVVQLRRRKWVEAATYPRFTLIGQSIGSVILGWEALVKQKPMLLIDTSGYAFIYPLARAVGCKVACYTHYPTISSDMVSRVMNRVSTYNNKGIVSRSLLLSAGKTLYYKMMAWAYGLAGKCADVAMVNSSWTQAHIVKLWGIPERTVLVYPPCDTVSLQALSLERSEKNRYIISVAQFRPEKAHEVQLQAFALALKRLERGEGVNLSTSGKPRLKLVGSCRHKEDEARLEALQVKCGELGIADDVDICKNVTYDELKSLLGGAVAGLHTMVDEHFGISVVEYMAAGVVPIAHRSAGPKLDIVREEGGQRTGFLAATVEEFADAAYAVLSMPEAERVEMARASRQRAAQFSEARFDDDFKAAMKPLAAQLV